MKSGVKFYLLILTIFCCCNFFLGFLFWPGEFTDDTFMQLEQALGFEPYVNWHPVTMTFLMGIFSSQKFQLFYYLGFQLLLISILGSIGVYILFKDILFLYKDKNSYRNNNSYRHDNLNRTKITILSVFVSLFLCLAPPNGIFDIIIWKDIPCTWLYFLLAVLISQLWYSDSTHFIDSTHSTESVNSADVTDSKNYKKLHNENYKKDYKKLYIQLIAIVFIAGLTMHFRQNAFTVAAIAISLSTLSVLYKAKFDKLKFVKIGSIILVTLSIVLVPRWMLKNHLTTNLENRNFADNFDVKSFVINVDFFEALKLGMPLEKSEEQELAKYIDIPKSLEKVKLTNTFYSLFPIYLENTVKSRQEFIQLAEKILLHHPDFWIYGKFKYTQELIRSVGGYQLPLFHENHLPEKENKFKIGLNKNPQLANYRNNWIRIMRFDFFKGNKFFKEHKYIFKIKFIFWSFWPTIFGHIAVALISFWIIRKKGLSFTTTAPLISVLLAMALCVPLAIVSSSNDFRYYWPAQMFLAVGVLNLLRQNLMLRSNTLNLTDI